MLNKLSALLSILIPLGAQCETVNRAAIDIGSGGPKLRIAEVDKTTNKIAKILKVQEFPVVFQHELAVSKTLSPEIRQRGILALKEAIDLAKSYSVEGIVIIGASIFRNALNGKQFAEQIENSLKLKVHLLDQELEGILAFQAAQAKSGYSAEDLIVWDIGGGSTQFVTQDTSGAYKVKGYPEGAGIFKDFIIQSIQKQNLSEVVTPNPISTDQAHLAENKASQSADKIDNWLKEKMKNPQTKIVGAGSVFGLGILVHLKGKTPFTVEDLTQAVKGLIGKTDADLGGDAYACAEVSSAILTLGYMKGLNIKEMSAVNINNADGAILYPPFWSQN
jgi:exopolyphosphatase/guanosine-5'-triphosphate,3'-diphosphate pyrophosphatase